MKNNVTGTSLISLRRGIRLLEFVALKKGGRTFSEIRAQFPDMTPATISRLVKSMQDETLLSKGGDSRNYQTGEKAIRLASAILGSLSKAETIRPAVNELAGKSGESALFSVFEDDAIRLLVKSEVAEGFHYMDENMTNPHLSTHAFGITCLAYQPKEKFKELFEKGNLHGMTCGKYLRLFEKIRREGVFVNKTDDKKNLARITAPVFYGEKGAFAGAIGVSFYSTGNDITRIRTLSAHVKESSRKASLLLGN